ncbi:ROK family protein, partial [Glutamicibacter sp.]|uniref:ROK family protein n=1 Tax=Glutamicibacter sp. TaxID=1931995 RepID=UPI003D6AC632
AGIPAGPPAHFGAQSLAAAASQGNPVDPRTLRPVVLPGAPFPEGHGDLLGVLNSLTAGPAIIDNDVNWSALAEQRTGVGRGVDEMLLVYLGPGIGAGVVMSGQVQRGFRVAGHNAAAFMHPRRKRVNSPTDPSPLKDMIMQLAPENRKAGLPA